MAHNGTRNLTILYKYLHQQTHRTNIVLYMKMDVFMSYQDHTVVSEHHENVRLLSMIPKVTICRAWSRLYWNQVNLFFMTAIFCIVLLIDVAPNVRHYMPAWARFKVEIIVRRTSFNMVWIGWIAKNSKIVCLLVWGDLLQTLWLWLKAQVCVNWKLRPFIENKNKNTK